MLRRVVNSHYWTANMDQAVAFYRDVLGLTPTLRAGEDWAEFEIGGSTIALHGSRPGVSAPQGGATVVFEVSDIEAAVRSFRQLGVPVDEEISETPVGRFASLHDPDGNIIQIFEGSG